MIFLLDRSARTCLLVALAMLLGLTAQAGRGADGEYDERSSSHFVLFQDVALDQTSGFYGSRRFEYRILETLEDAYRLLEELLGLRIENEIIVTIHDPQIFDARFGGTFRFPLAGFYGGTIHVRGATGITDRLTKTLHHELVHAAFDAALPNLHLPAWFNEGVAEWFEARSIGQRRLQRRQLTALNTWAINDQLFGFEAMSGGNFGHLGPEGVRIAYLESFGFFEYLTRVHGDRPLRDLCRNLVRRADLESSFRRVYRSDIRSLGERYVEDLRGIAD